MSYDIYLRDPVSREVLEVDTPHHIAGGTYCVGGTTELHLSITYNYAAHFRRILGENGISTIYGMSGAESIPVLLAATKQLGDDVSDRYWDATEATRSGRFCNSLRWPKCGPMACGTATNKRMAS